MRIAAASVLTLLLFVVADAADAATRPRLKAFDACKIARRLRARGRAADAGRRRRRRPRRAADGRRGGHAADRAAARADVERHRGKRARAGVGAGLGRYTGRAARSPSSPARTCRRLDVDEPDILKTDGRRIFAVTDRTLRVVDPAAGQVTGTLALDGFGHRLLLRGDRVLVIASKGATRRLSRRQPAGRADDRAGVEHPRSSPRSTSPRRAEGDAHDGGRRAASSTRARTAPPRGS